MNALEQMSFVMPNTLINEGDYNEEIPIPKNSSIYPVMDTLRSIITLSYEQRHSMNFVLKARFFSHDPLQASLLDFKVKSSSVALLNTTSSMKAFVEFDNPSFHSNGWCALYFLTKCKAIEGACLDHTIQATKTRQCINWNSNFNLCGKSNNFHMIYLFPRVISLCKGKTINTHLVIKDLEPKLWHPLFHVKRIGQEIFCYHWGLMLEEKTPLLVLNVVLILGWNHVTEIGVRPLTTS